MKKKLLILSIIPFLLTGCSLFNDIFDSGENYTYKDKVRAMMNHLITITLMMIHPRNRIQIAQ